MSLPPPPPPPRAPYFDADAGAWVLSRYADVFSVFRDSRLWPVSSRGDDDGHGRNGNGALTERARVRDQVFAAMPDLQRDMERSAATFIDSFDTNRPIELLHEFARPWCLSVAMSLTGVDLADCETLDAIGARVFAGTAAPRDSAEREDARNAVSELEKYFADCRIPMAQSTFVGVSQTLPRLLVNGWLALFEHPGEVARLRSNPDLMALAVEELLRFAGIVSMLYRKARQPIEIAGLGLAAGDRVTLMINSANRDPEKFADPDRLDVSRRAVGQLTLGIGHNSCAGARLIRTANGVAIGAMLNAFSDMRVTGTIPWCGASGSRWPSSVHVLFRRHAAV